MIALSPAGKILVYSKPVDFRKGIDGLIGLCRNHLHEEPLSSCVFLFINTRHTSIKILTYDGQGFWLCQKRLSKGRFRYWPRFTSFLTLPQILVLLYNGNPEAARFAPFWKKIL